MEISKCAALRQQLELSKCERQTSVSEACIQLIRRAANPNIAAGAQTRQQNLSLKSTLREMKYLA